MTDENEDWRKRYDALLMDVHRLANESASLKARNQLLEEAAKVWDVEKKNHQVIFQQRMDQMNADLQRVLQENDELKTRLRAALAT
jgi:hypothetical protein